MHGSSFFSLHFLTSFKDFVNFLACVGILRAWALNNASVQTLETNNSDVVETPDEQDQWKIKMLYDGDCPLCLREVFFDALIYVMNNGFY